MTDQLTLLGMDLWAKGNTQARKHSTLSLVECRCANAALRIPHQEVRWGEIWAEVVADGS